MWACDFETYPNTEKTWVWAWGAANIQNPDEFVYGDSISDFFSWALNEKTLYFHNLKFDGAFIIDYLLKNGWEWVKDKPKINEFTTLISMNGLWYSITIKTNNGLLKIYDSLKKRKKVQGLDKATATGKRVVLPFFKLRRTRQREQLLRGTFLVCRLDGTVQKHRPRPTLQNNRQRHGNGQVQAHIYLEQKRRNHASVHRRHDRFRESEIHTFPLMDYQGKRRYRTP